jgi:hypothetical protein
MRNAYNILVGKPAGKRPLRRHRRRWDDIIKVDVKEIGCECVYGIHMTEDRFQ